MKKMILVIVLLCTVSKAGEYDNFFQQEDKKAHIAISVMTGAIGNLVSIKLGASKQEAFWYGLGTSLVIGGLKEVYDMHKTNPTGFSMADMVADGIGGVVGTGSVTLLTFNSGDW